MLIGLLVAGACGAIMSAAMPPNGFWPLSLTLTPLFALVALSKSTRDAFWLGYVFAIAFFVLYLLWIPLSFSEILNPSFWLAFPVLVNWLAIIWGSTTALCRWIAGRGVGSLLLLPAAWVIVEWIRTQGYLGFPWGTFGYVWLDTPVAQISDLIGIYGLSLVSTVLAALLAVPFVRPNTFLRSQRGLLRLLLALAIPLTFGAAVWSLGVARSKITFPTSTASALLVQANVNPLDRTIGHENDLRLHNIQTVNGLLSLPTPNIVVWPEGSIIESNITGIQGQANREMIQANAPSSIFIVGGRIYQDGDFFNSVYSLSNANLDDRYDKVFLVPFGERWPLINTAAPIYRAIFNLLDLPFLQSTAPGEKIRPLHTALGLVGAYICYESVFPEVQRIMVRQGAKVLINITNDTWFGRGNGAQQHFEMGRLRAIETRRYLLRAGNDGITALVDPRGAILAQLERGVTATLPVQFGLSDLRTPWVRYGHLYIPLVLAYFLVVALLALLRRS